ASPIPSPTPKWLRCRWVLFRHAKRLPSACVNIPPANASASCERNSTRHSLSSPTQQSPRYPRRSAIAAHNASSCSRSGRQGRRAPGRRQRRGLRGGRRFVGWAPAPNCSARDEPRPHALVPPQPLKYHAGGLAANLSTDHVCGTPRAATHCPRGTGTEALAGTAGGADWTVTEEGDAMGDQMRSSSGVSLLARRLADVRPVPP